jgi:hypothetical protein
MMDVMKENNLPISSVLISQPVEDHYAISQLLA